VRRLALIVLAYGGGVEPQIHTVAAQVAAHVEAGFSEVKYDGFLASGAASVAPNIRWEHPRGRGFISARGTYLHFESGRHSLDASANGSWFVPLGSSRRWRGEIAMAGGASEYADIASFNHLVLESRLHLTEGDHGGWVGVTIGRSSFGSEPRPAAVVAMGVWLLPANKTMFVSLDRTRVGDTVYSDLRSSGRWQKDKLVLEGILGARFWSQGGGRGVFGEGSAIYSFSPATALVLSGGRYPTDVVSGSIAGRYVSLAVRLGKTTIRRRVRPASPSRGSTDATHSNATDPAGSPATDIRLTIQKQQGDDVRLTLYVPRAQTVEISGDFTDWEPVSLERTRSDADLWEATFRMTRGMHRINVRRDGGTWTAPGGTTRSTDDFDGEVGIFTIP
jgi:hypothetical protein